MTIVVDPESVSSGGTITPFGPAAELDIGPHNLFHYRGLTLNDRKQNECYWIEELDGFDDPDLRIASPDESPNEEGERPGPGFYGGRTMTMTGYIHAWNYPRIMQMSTDLRNAFKVLAEHPLEIVTNPSSLIFGQPQVYINCRKNNSLKITKKVQQSDLNGPLKRPFQISLRATDPVYRAIIGKSESMVPSVVSAFGRSYPRAYPLAYNVQMDSNGNPASGANSMAVINAGDWLAWPVITFEGYMAGVQLINDTNGQQIRLAQPVADGDLIQIDTKAGTVIDAAGVNRFSAFDTRSDWMRLNGTPDAGGGTNNLILVVTGFGANALVTIDWADTYL